MDRQHSRITASRLHAARLLQPRRNRRWLVLIVYAVASGTVAVVVGAVVSLAAPGTHRLALWAAATGATAAAAGVARESRLIATCRLACGRLLRRLARPSATS